MMQDDCWGFLKASCKAWGHCPCWITCYTCVSKVTPCTHQFRPKHTKKLVLGLLYMTHLRERDVIYHGDLYDLQRSPCVWTVNMLYRRKNSTSSMSTHFLSLNRVEPWFLQSSDADSRSYPVQHVYLGLTVGLNQNKSFWKEREMLEGENYRSVWHTHPIDVRI